ncbi:MAG: alpha/beta hydrolase [Proteobacteria bacterium]|nr:alpha/beta hydrolase [Pseudomonadota bacterium]
MNGYREHRFTSQDGLSLYYRAYGAENARGTPVLCLTGLTRNSRDFHRVAQRLSGDRLVLCPDYRGRGRSDYDPDSNNYQPATYLNDIRHLLAIAGIGRIAVIGTSLGGLLAMAMGAAMPTVLAGVVLNDVGPEIGGAGLARIVDYIGTDRPHPDWASAARDLAVMFPHLSLESDEAWEAAARATWREGDDGILHYDWDVRIAEPIRAGAPLPDLWGLYRSLGQLPLLAVRGALSDILSPETLSRMADAHPGLQQVTVAGVGHVPSLSEPDITDTLDAFVAAL